MKRNKGKVVLSLFASLLCIGAIGGTSYYLYRLNNDINNKNEDKFKITINYYKDNKLDESLTKLLEFNKNTVIKRDDYKINLTNYLYETSTMDEEVIIKEDKTFNFYYKMKETSYDNEVEVKAYISTNGIDGNNYIIPAISNPIDIVSPIITPDIPESWLDKIKQILKYIIGALVILASLFGLNFIFNLLGISIKDIINFLFIKPFKWIKKKSSKKKGKKNGKKK